MGMLQLVIFIQIMVYDDLYGNIATQRIGKIDSNCNAQLSKLRDAVIKIYRSI